MLILITGKRGFIGTALEKNFQAQGHQVKGISRKLLTNPAKIAKEIKGVDIIINLAGASISKKWNKLNKLEIFKSRVQTTRNIILALWQTNPKPKLFISASAIGIYDETHVHDETSTFYDKSFLAHVCIDWEKEAIQTDSMGLRTIITRIGIVLSPEGGTLKKLRPIFNLGLGATFDKGTQAMSFIALEDLIEAFNFVINNEQCFGNYNFVAPQSTTNQIFSKLFAQSLQRPLWFSLPVWFINFWFGQKSELFLKGQKVIPQKLMAQGFSFKYKTINDYFQPVKVS